MASPDSLLLPHEREYLQNELLKKRNANIPFTGLSFAIGVEEHEYNKKVIEEIGQRFPQWYKLETSGTIYTFKIRSRGDKLPYCAGAIVTRVTEEEKIRLPGYTVSVAKHYETVLNHIDDIGYLLALERTGATGQNFVDATVAPYIREEKLDYKRIKQGVQGYVFNVNKPKRYFYQSRFENWLLAIGTDEKVLSETDVFLKAKPAGKAIDYVDEMKLFLKAFCEVLLEGDADGRPFTFPIPSVYLTKFFLKVLEEDAELWELFWRTVAHRGSFYFMNPHVSPPGKAFSFCCRLTIDTRR